MRNRRLRDREQLVHAQQSGRQHENASSQRLYNTNPLAMGAVHARLQHSAKPDRHGSFSLCDLTTTAQCQTLWSLLLLLLLPTSSTHMSHS